MVPPNGARSLEHADRRRKLLRGGTSRREHECDTHHCAGKRHLRLFAAWQLCGAVTSFCYLPAAAHNNSHPAITKATDAVQPPELIRHGVGGHTASAYCIKSHALIIEHDTCTCKVRCCSHVRPQDISIFPAPHVVGMQDGRNNGSDGIQHLQICSKTNLRLHIPWPEVHMCFELMACLICRFGAVTCELCSRRI